MTHSIRFRAGLGASITLAALLAAMPARASEAGAADAAPAADAAVDLPMDAAAIIVTAKQTRSATAITAVEIQKILPGVSPLKAIETLPGVLYITADPWGNNEQNAQIFIHGFNFQQLGYTMDGVPLGDQNYGNYNGLSPQRAVISENVSRTIVSTGAGDLGTPSTSNLGGAIEVFSADPADERGAQIAQTIGSYGTSRTFARIDTGTFDIGGLKGNRLYLSGLRQRARAWDFAGKQGGYQANAKFVHEDDHGKLTLFFDYSDKIEPNEDATVFFKPSAGGTATPAQLFTPYTRPYFYPDFTGNRAYIDANGNTPAAQGNNYRNYYSDAQRTDYLAYAKYDAHLTDKITWSNQVYFHHDDGVGVVAGPLGQSITVFQAYLDPAYGTLPSNCRFSTNNNGVKPAACTALTTAQAAAAGSALVAATGGSGLATRTTEYRIDRHGLISKFNIDLGAHQVEVGGWYEFNSATQYRRWYALDVNNPNASTPYIRPSNPLFTQYQGEARVDELQFHIQDTWSVTPRLTVEAGIKSSAQYANGFYVVQPRAGSLSGLTGGLPQGRINTSNYFLPAFGAKYKVTDSEEIYINVQKNLRQFMTYQGGGGTTPWFTGSQSAFDAFAATGKPETSVTYEGGLRTKRSFPGAISAIEGQINYYHVDFSNRQLAISTNPGGIAGGAIAGGTSILTNVGNVRTDGVDAALTVHLFHAFSLYNAVSYNLSKYASDYTSTATGIGAATGTCIGGFLVTGGVVPTCGKQIPGAPKWMNKTVATLSVHPFDLQLIGDFVGRRFTTFSNDASVPSYFLMSARLSVALPAEKLHLRKAELSVNVTNLDDSTGVSTVSVGSTTNSYSAYPIAPRQVFGTLSIGF
jgi:hypothetical protein